LRLQKTTQASSHYQFKKNLTDTLTCGECLRTFAVPLLYEVTQVTESYPKSSRQFTYRNTSHFYICNIYLIY